MSATNEIEKMRLLSADTLTAKFGDKCKLFLDLYTNLKNDVTENTQLINLCEKAFSVTAVDSLNKDQWILVLSTELRRMYNNAEEMPKLKATPKCNNLIKMTNAPESQFQLRAGLSAPVNPITIYPSMASHTPNKINHLFSLLTDDQKAVFSTIHQKISNSYGEQLSIDGSFVVEVPFIGLLDSNPGTGKSTTLNILATTLNKMLIFLVYQKHLKSKASEYGNICAFTCCKFLMTITRMPYEDIRFLFCRGNLRNNIEDLHAYEQTLCLFPSIETDFILVDEYTVLHPITLFVYYLYCRKFKKNLLFVGDKYQQSSISKSRYHHENNYGIVVALSSISLKLLEQVRITDPEYKKNIDVVKNMLIGSRDNKKMSFALKYELFLLFEEKFYTKDDYRNLFITQYHDCIKKRIQLTEQYLRAKNIPYLQSKYYELSDNPQSKFRKANFSNPESLKFLTYLPIICGYKYLYLDDQGNRTVVTCMGEEDGKFLCTDDESGELLSLSRIRLTSEIMGDEWMKVMCDARSFYHYPVKLLHSTYAAAQGLTLSKEIIEIDLDTMYLNAVYVGLSRIKSGEQLHKIHSNHTFSFVLTKYFDDGHFYRLSKKDTVVNTVIRGYILDYLNENAPIPTKIKSAFKTVTFRTFETKEIQRNMKIERLTYEEEFKQNEQQQSLLCHFAAYLTENYDDFIKTETSDVYWKFSEYYKSVTDGKTIEDPYQYQDLKKQRDERAAAKKRKENDSTQSSTKNKKHKKNSNASHDDE